MYAKDRFYQSTVTFKKKDGGTVTGEQYTYESHARLYDVVRLNGGLLVRINMGSLSPFICDWTPAHYEIENHFDL